MPSVIINGTFDILHKGHLELIKFGRLVAGSGRLTIAIDSDRRVRELKGPQRPINSQYERVAMLENIKGVDLVYIFDTNQELETIIKGTKSTIMVKGVDYVGKHIVGGHLVEHVVFIPKVNGYSTTDNIQKIADTMRTDK